jgi:ERF superfamily
MPQHPTPEDPQVLPLRTAGTNSTASPKNIFQRISAVQKSIGYIQKDRSISAGGGSYKAISHDTVTAMLRQHLIENGIVVSTSLAGEAVFDPPVDGAKQRLFRAEFVISFINVDDPSDRLMVTLPAHAMDNSDKSCGKAISYATKYALLKTFLLETGEDEESRHQTGDYDFEAALAMAAQSNKEDARAIITEARTMALKLKDAGAARDVAAMAKVLAEKFRKLEAIGDDVAGQA